MELRGIAIAMSLGCIGLSLCILIRAPETAAINFGELYPFIKGGTIILMFIGCLVLFHFCDALGNICRNIATESGDKQYRGRRTKATSSLQICKDSTAFVRPTSQPTFFKHNPPYAGPHLFPAFRYAFFQGDFFNSRKSVSAR